MIFYPVFSAYLRKPFFKRMSIKTTLILLLGLILSLPSLSAQNRKDEQGRRQGPWKKFHEGTNIVRYTGEFKDDVPIGTFKYFYRNGKLFSENVYRGQTGACYSIQFAGNGKRLAEGVLRHQKKDSVWTYYDRNQNIISKEVFKDGELHGERVTFFANGSTLEKMNFENGLRQGKFIEYHENGKVYMRGEYLDDKLHGELRIYLANGNKRAEGKYVEGEKHDKWIWFNDNGRPERIEEYRYGQLMKEREIVED